MLRGELFEAIASIESGRFHEKDAASVMRDAIVAIQYVMMKYLSS